MSKPKKKRKFSKSQASSSQQQEPEEEHDVTVLYDPTSASSAPSTSASASASTSDDKVQKYFDKLDSTLREKRVCEVVRYLLCAQGRGIPVKKKELVDKVVAVDVVDRATITRALPVILDRANDQLQEVFGLELKKIKRGAVEAYILVNKLPSSLTEGHVIWMKSDKARQGLLAVILFLILTKQEKISEDNLWKFLTRLKLSPEKRGSTFEDVEKTISKEFVAEMYLDRVKLLTGDKHTFVYSWGPRAKEEVDKIELVKFMGDAYGAKIDSWLKHFGEDSSSAD